MDSLEAAGLAKNEAIIYRILLKNSSGTVTELSRKSEIHRRSVYDVLQRLSDKGLVSYMVVEGVKRFFPNNPKKLSELLQKREETLNKELPDLEGLFNQNAEKKSTQFFMGKQGIKYILDEQLRLKKEILILGGSNTADDMLKYYFPKYHKNRVREKIPLKMIYAGKDKKRRSSIPYSEIKHMPKGKGGDMAFNIFGNNVALIMWKQENPFVILISEEEVADTFRDYFEFIWSKL